MLSCVKDGVTTTTPGHQTTGNVCVIWKDESSFMLFPTSGNLYVWRTPKEVYNAWLQQWNTGEVLSWSGK
jgi:hypothetical protein